MLLAHDGGVKSRAGGRQRVNGRVDAQLRDGAGEDRGGVQVRERGGRCRVGQVVCGDVDGLDGRDGALLGGGDALLQLAHLGGQRGLVADGRRHAAEKCGDLGAGLREAEDVVDEQQHVLALVTEVLGRGQTGESHAHTGSGRLVHLSVDQAGLVDNAGLGHLEEEVRALTGALADAREDGRAAMLLGEVVDELLDEDGLADAGAAEQAGLAAADVGLQQVDGLDARLEDLGLGGQVLEGGSRVVDGIVLDVVRRLAAVDRLANDVPDAAQRGRADGHHHGVAGVLDLEATGEAVGRGHCDGADDAALELGLDLQHGVDVTHGGVAVNDERGVDAGHLAVELDVDDRSDDTNDRALAHALVELVVRGLLEGGTRLLGVLWH